MTSGKKEENSEMKARIRKTRDTETAEENCEEFTAARALLFFRSRCLISREVASADGHGDDAIRNSGGNRSSPARKQLLFRHGNLTRPVVTRFFSESCGCNKSDVRVLPPVFFPDTVKCSELPVDLIGTCPTLHRPILIRGDRARET